jgi:Arc/MetJ-type ribon-helix-helix transcriptional regulator
MRNIVNISLPREMTAVVEKNVKSGHYASKSEFFRMLLRLWMEGKLADEIVESKAELRSGKGKLLQSLRDLRS